MSMTERDQPASVLRVAAIAPARRPKKPLWPPAPQPTPSAAPWPDPPGVRSVMRY